MAENLLTAPLPDEKTAAPDPVTTDPSARSRPPHVPEKFWDPETGEIRVEALLKSYLELERRLSTGERPAETAAPADPQSLRRMWGVPDTPDGYGIACPHGLFEPDTDINQRLHEAGFSPEQAQLVYDLAAERMVPMIQDLAAEFEADREIRRLVDHFGGEDRWREVSRQILAWANKNLPAPVIHGLSTTYDGILALHRMMTGAEPAAMRDAAPAATAQGEGDLHRMMRDPRYWRDRDPSFIAQVTDGFKRLYPDRP